jgi:hypothetical protein
MICFKLFALFLVATIGTAEDTPKLIIQHAPSYQTYDTSTTLKLSDLKSLLLAVNGFTVDAEIQWTVLKSTNSMASPKVNLLFLTDSNRDLEIKESDKAIEIDQDTLVDFEYLKNFFDARNKGLFKSFDSVPAGKELKALGCSKSLDSVFYVIKVSEADSKESINERIKTVGDNCVTKDDLMVYILATDKNSRVKRDILEKRVSGSRILNTAIFYSDDYPVMFHLLFWTSLVIGLTVIAITCGMAKMDPGLDTVIYRMTSQRIKKDN